MPQLISLPHTFLRINVYIIDLVAYESAKLAAIVAENTKPVILKPRGSCPAQRV